MNAELVFDKMEEDHSVFDEKMFSFIKLGTISSIRESIKARDGEYVKARSKLFERFKGTYDEKDERITSIKAGEEIWRGVLADHEYITSLIEGKASTGICWSYDKNKASARASVDRPIHIKLTASIISGESINEKDSHLLGLCYHNEKEIRLNFNEKILLKSIEILYNPMRNKEDKKYPKGLIIPINKIVQTGDQKPWGDGKIFEKREGIKPNKFKKRDEN